MTGSVHNLETSSTVFELNKDTRTWSLRFNSSSRYSIENAVMALQYRVGRSFRRASLAPMRGKPSTIALPRPLDPKDGIIATVGPTVDGIEVTIEFALFDEASALVFSQGSGIKTWEVSKSSVRAFLDYGRTTHGSAWLSLPGKLRSPSINGRSVCAGMIEPGIIKIDI